MFSRRKIRGYKRKLNQLKDWKEFIINYNYENNYEKLMFRVHWGKIVWYRATVPNQKLHLAFFEALNEIINSLSKNSVIKDSNLRIQLLIYYPRIQKSVVLVASTENTAELNSLIGLRDSNIKPPTIIGELFKGFSIKLADDDNFKYVDNKDFTYTWTKIRQGDIWVIE